MKTKVTPMSGERSQVTFPAYEAVIETTNAAGEKTTKKVTVPAYTNVVRNTDLKAYVTHIEATRAEKPANWSPSWPTR